MAEAAAAGATFDDIHRRATDGEGTPPPRRHPRRGLTGAARHLRAGDGASAGVLVGEEVVPAAALGAPADTVRGVLAELDAAGLAALGERPCEDGKRVARAGVRLLAPVPDPEKIICMGLNYRDHAEEASRRFPSTRAGSRSSPTP